MLLVKEQQHRRDSETTEQGQTEVLQGLLSNYHYNNVILGSGTAIAAGMQITYACWTDREAAARLALAHYSSKWMQTAKREGAATVAEHK